MSNFTGFTTPEENWSKLPHQFIEIMPTLETKSEVLVLLYILRHTWGYHEFNDGKRITVDEFMSGRKNRRGERIDGGCGLSKPSIIDGLKRAEKHGFIEVTTDSSDMGRVKKLYRIKLTGKETLPLESKDFTPDVKEVDPRGKEDLLRTGKETLERNKEKEEEERSAYASELAEINQPETAPSSPSPSASISEPTGDIHDGYFGMSDNRPEWQSNRDKHLKDYDGVSAKVLVELTNELKRIRGFDALVDNPGRDSLELEFKDEAFDLWKIGVSDADTMKDYRDRWVVHARANKYKTLSPWPGQFYKFVVQCISGSVAAQSNVATRPSYLNIPEL